MSDTEIVETPQVETPVAEAPVVEQPKETFDQTLERVSREVMEGKCGPDGKFQSRVAAPSAPETPEVPGRPQTAAPPDPAPPGTGQP